MLKCETYKYSSSWLPANEDDDDATQNVST